MEGEDSETGWRAGVGEGGGVGSLSRAGGQTSSYWSGAFDPDPGKAEKNLEEAKLLPC